MISSWSCSVAEAKHAAPLAPPSMDDVDARTQRRRSAIKGAFFSEVIDMFDIYLPVVVLSPIMGYFQGAGVEPASAALLGSLVFITTLLGRPLGAVLFGMIADRIGRRMASIYSVAGFSVITLLIGLIPGYAQIGIASYLLLVVLRFLDGICLGGGYTGAHPLALESSNKEHRGLVGGLLMSGFCLAYVAINLVAIATFAVFPLDGLDSPYAEWGWRIPFMIGAVLGGVLALYYIYHVSESEIWTQETGGGQARQPLATLMRGHAGRQLLQVLLMMTGFWTTQNIITIFLPSTLLPTMLHMSKVDISITLLVTYSILFFTYIGAGMLGQKIGRRRSFLILGPLIATVGSGLLYLLAHGEGLPQPAIMALVALLAVLVTAPWGIIVTYINERFVTDVRATGFGVGFSLSVIVPSFYAFYLQWLGQWVGATTAPALLLCLGAVIATVGAAMGPETRDVDF
jgi:MFS family permease